MNQVDWSGYKGLHEALSDLRFVVGMWDRQALCEPLDVRTDDILRGIDSTILKLKQARDFVETSGNVDT